MKKIDTMIRILKNKGISQLLQQIYRFAVRQAPIPRRVAVYNGVNVKRASILELKNHFPDEEEHSVSQIKQYVSSGDTAVVIGGGWGVCAAQIAKKVGESGYIIVYEAAEQFAERTEETIQLNSFTDRAEVHHTMVSTKGQVWGAEDGAKRVSSKDLPVCDVLHLDCDGAEYKILSELPLNPRVVIVEIHGMYGVAEEDIDQIMIERGYDVADKRTFDERQGGYVKTYTQ